MIDPDGLNVWCNQDLVGHIWRDTQGRMGFNYAQEWLSSTNHFAISCQLPLQKDEFLPQHHLAHRFFANLLPEGGAREQVVRDFKIPNTDFDLLRAIGGECAGALSILQTQYAPSPSGDYHLLNETELYQLVARKGRAYNWDNDERPRLSLAGAQNKSPVFYINNNYYLPKKEAASSHILKFELNDYRHLPAYETYTSLLARAIGLPVVDIHFAQRQDKTFARIKRYDRLVNDDGLIRRLHQEDFCQALGFGYERKYQEEGGASFADCYRLVRDHSTDPVIDLPRLLQWQIFNVLAGNSDGHSKNLSLLYLPNGDIRLAPFYDLICTRAIERIDERLAMAVGGERNPSLVTLAHWEKLAQECDISPRFVQQQVKLQAQALEKNCDLVKNQFEQLYGQFDALQRIVQVVKKQCRKAR